MTGKEFAAVVLSFPGAAEGTSYGQPSFKVRDKFFTRVRAEDNSAVLACVPADERDFLMEADPGTFHFTPHYKDYPIVLARLEGLTADHARGFLERQWRKLATKTMIRNREAARLS